MVHLIKRLGIRKSEISLSLYQQWLHFAWSDCAGHLFAPKIELRPVEGAGEGSVYCRQDPHAGSSNESFPKSYTVSYKPHLFLWTTEKACFVKSPVSMLSLLCHHICTRVLAQAS